VRSSSSAASPVCAHLGFTPQSVHCARLAIGAGRDDGGGPVLRCPRKARRGRRGLLCVEMVPAALARD